MLSAKDVVKAHKVLSGVVANTPLDYDHYYQKNTELKFISKKKMLNESALLKFVELIMPSHN